MFNKLISIIRALASKRFLEDLQWSIQVLSLCMVLLAWSYTTARSQNDRLATGQWRAHFSYSAGRQVTVSERSFYMTCEAGIAVYNFTNQRYTELSKVDGLSGNNATAIVFDSVSKTIFVGYSDGTIDYFTDSLRISSILDLTLSTQVTNKRINQLHVHDGLLYVACEFGALVLNIARKEIRYSFLRFGNEAENSPVRSIAVFDGFVYAALGNKGLYRVPLSAPNPQDATQWVRADTLQGFPLRQVYRLAATTDLLYAASGTQLLSLAKRTLQNPSPQWENRPYNTEPTIPQDSIRFLKATPDRLFFGIQNGVFYHDGQSDTYFFQLFVTQPADWAEWRRGAWGAVADLEGLRVCFGRDVGPSRSRGPGNNQAESVVAHNGEVTVAPAFFFNSIGLYHRPAPDSAWQVWGESTGILAPERASRNFGRVIYSPDRKRIWAGGLYQGLVSIDIATRNVTYFDEQDGCLTGASRGPDGKWRDLRPTDMAFDSRGNLWVVSPYTQQPLTVITPEGECTSFPSPYPGTSLFIRIAIDQLDQLWIAAENGVVVYDYNKTPLNRSDDRYTLLQTGEGRGNLAGTPISLAVDGRNVVWVGCRGGVTAFYNPGAVLTNPAGGSGNCPIFEQFCLLNSENVSAIHVDPAGRKWFGTSGSGAYLFNEDGTRQLLHFTTANSPLVGNQITDIQVDGVTGEVFFCMSENGLISWRGDASTPAPDYTTPALYAFPNPYYTDGLRGVTITGVMDQTEVRLVTSAGQLVRKLTSNGGTVAWDGRDQQGNKPQTGIYTFLFSDAKGSTGGRLSIAVINR
jgi:hypothetical protein